MSIKVMTTVIQFEDYLTMEESHASMEEALTRYAERHKDFTVLFEKHLDKNELVIKTLSLQEHIN